jgi:large subunit ribosomal protein L13
MSYTAGTFIAKPSYVQKRWLLIDAAGVTLGKLATQIAMTLRGKHKAYYTPFIDCGDNIVVINAAQVKVTGKKLEQKKFFWHTGYPGGLKERTFGQILSGAHPERLLEKAVQRMMPKDSPLARNQMKNLHIYANAAHKHHAQQPELITIGA